MPRIAIADLGPSLHDIAARIAAEEGVDARLVRAVIQQESGGQLDRTSVKGAIGPMQLMPSTAAMLGVNPHDPEQNLRGGVRYLKQQLDAFGGDSSKALAAYNAGPEAVRRAGGVPNYPETQNYVTSILQRAGMTMPAAAPAQSTTTATAFPSSVGQPPPGLAGQMRVPLSAVQPATPVSRGTALVGAPPPGPEPGFLASLASGFDPRTSTGRRNLVAGAGALGAGLLTEGAGALPTFAAIAGAGAGGALEEGGEQLAGTRPPDLGAVGEAGVEQAGYEVLGHTLLWPVKALGRRLITPAVAASARTSLQSIREGLSTQLDAVLTKAAAALRSARVQRGLALTTERDAGQASRDIAASTARTRIAVTKTAGEDLRETARAAQATRLKDLQSQLGAVPPGPSPAVAGRQAGAVLAGPAQSALDRVGEQVGAAAETGPTVNLAPVKQALRDMATRTYPEALRPEAAGMGMVRNLMTRATSPEQQQLILAAVKDQIGAADHPLPGMLGKLLEAPDEISFADAHRFKRLLDETVNWDSPAKQQVKQMTKGIRGTLREAMAGHAPYDTATKAYQDLIPLYRRGLAPQIKKQLAEYPEYAVNTIKPTHPTKLVMLKELLTTQAAKGGGDAEGQAAWDSVRGSWVHRYITNGPVEGLSDRLAKLTPEFRAILADDTSGRSVLSHLDQIGQAYQHAVQTGLAEMDMAKSTSDFLLQQAQDRAAQTIQGARLAVRRSYNTVKLGQDSAVRRLTDDLVAARTAKAASHAQTFTEKAFVSSTVAKVRRPEQVETDVARAVLLSPHSAWQNLAVFRLLKGPRSADLVQWAAYSPKWTHVLVHLLTHPELGMATADAGRLLGQFYLDTDASESQRLTGSDGRRLTRGVVAGLDHAGALPRLRSPQDAVLGTADNHASVRQDLAGTPPPGLSGDQVGAPPPSPPATVGSGGPPAF